MKKDCVYIDDSYRFDFSTLLGLLDKGGRSRRVELYIEAPQGFVRLLRRISDFLSECLASKGYEATVHIKLEPVFGACALSIDELKYIDKNALLVHLGHDPYIYPICTGVTCYHGSLPNVVFVPGEYMGGSVEEIVENIRELLGTSKRLAIGYSVQHRMLSYSVAEALSRNGYDIKLIAPVLGCYYYNLVKYRDVVDAFIVIAGGYFHSLGLGLALGGEKTVLRADPYSNKVENIGDKVLHVLSKRYWTLSLLSSAKSLGIIIGLLPGQYRPWIASFIEALARRRGIKTYKLYARYLSREVLDNLSPSDYDAFVVTSCPRLAIDDLGDYWKPVLTPAEARLWLTDALGKYSYTFPW